MSLWLLKEPFFLMSILINIYSISITWVVRGEHRPPEAPLNSLGRLRIDSRGKRIFSAWSGSLTADVSSAFVWNQTDLHADQCSFLVKYLDQDVQGQLWSSFGVNCSLNDWFSFEESSISTVKLSLTMIWPGILDILKEKESKDHFTRQK